MAHDTAPEQTGHHPSLSSSFREAQTPSASARRPRDALLRLEKRSERAWWTLLEELATGNLASPCSWCLASGDAVASPPPSPPSAARTLQEDVLPSTRTPSRGSLPRGSSAPAEAPAAPGPSWMIKTIAHFDPESPSQSPSRLVGVGDGAALSQEAVGAQLARSGVSLRSLKGRKPAPNQDRAAVVSLVGGRLELLLVLDGHGEHGHAVAELCSEVLPKLLLQQLGAAPSAPELRAAAERSFAETHRLLEQLTVAEQLDARQSGTTASLLLLMPGAGGGGSCTVASVGDSRVVLGTPASGQARAITRDHRLEDPEERRRIEQAGAQVLGERGALRVYSPQQSWPMINMTRSLGDLHAHTQGLISEAEVSTVQLRSASASAASELLVLASDGAWDVLCEEDAVSLAARSRAQGRDPAEAIAQECYRRWLLRGDYADDITVLVKVL